MRQTTESWMNTLNLRMYFILRKQEMTRVQQSIISLSKQLEEFDFKINDENNTTDMKSFYYESKFSLLTKQIARLNMELEDFQNNYEESINVCRGHSDALDLCNEPGTSTPACSSDSACSDDACKEF